ncbi:phage antirepressor KilAC domain-containing protein, partial [Acinetobacter baumannii]
MSITVLKNDSLINYFSDDAVATGQIQLTDPMQLLADPNLLRNALLTYSEKVIELEHKVEVMQPTMEAFARIARAEGSMCLTDAAKALQQEPHKFNKWLHMND